MSMEVYKLSQANRPPSLGCFSGEAAVKRPFTFEFIKMLVLLVLLLLCEPAPTLLLLVLLTEQLSRAVVGEAVVEEADEVLEQVGAPCCC